MGVRELGGVRSRGTGSNNSSAHDPFPKRAVGRGRCRFCGRAAKKKKGKKKEVRVWKRGVSLRTGWDVHVHFSIMHFQWVLWEAVTHKGWNKGKIGVVKRESD